MSTPAYGQSILDLDAERAQLEYAIEKLDGSAPASLLERMRRRLDEIADEAESR